MNLSESEQEEVVEMLNTMDESTILESIEAQPDDLSDDLLKDD